MRILYIIESLTSGGKERRLLSLIKGLVVKDNIEIEIVILSDDIHYQEIYDLNIKIHFLKRSIKKDLAILLKFNKILKGFEPNIVHCWDNMAAFHFGPICKIKKFPFLNSMIADAPKLLSRFSKQYLIHAVSYPFSDIILSNSHAGLLAYRAPKSKGIVIHNGFDLNRKIVKISEDIIRKKFNITTRFIVGMTGAFMDRKDYKTYVEAGQKVLSKQKDVTFLAIGDGPNLDEIKNSISENYLSNFRFVGKQHDVDSIVKTFDIGVLSSFREGISNAIMEYMMFAKPVIATRGGGTEELMINNETGFIVGLQDAVELAEKIEYLLENPQIAAEMGKKGKERIETQFSIDKMVDEFHKLYKEKR